MTNQYLLRADLAFGFLDGVPISTSLPVNLGPFQLNHSPNAAMYLADLGLIDPDQPAREQHDRFFPISLLYLEHRFEHDNEGNPTRYADDALDRLERLLRVFQPGEIAVRRHGLWHVDEDGRQTPGWSFSAHDFRPAKSPIEGLHEYGEYPLDDATLSKLIKFIDRFWDALDRSHANLRIAMARFSSSYEKRDLSLGSRGYRFAIDRRINAVHLKEYTFSGAMRENARRIQDLTGLDLSRKERAFSLRAHRWTRILSLAIPGPSLAIGLLALMEPVLLVGFLALLTLFGLANLRFLKLCRRSRGPVFALQAGAFLFFEMLAAEYFTLRAYLKNWRTAGDDSPT